MAETREHTWWGRLVLWPVMHPIASLVIAAILCVAAAVRVTQLRPETGIDSMFPENSAASQSLLRVMHTFGAAEQMLVLVSDPGEDDPNPQRLLAFAQRLEQAIAASPEASQLCDGISYRVDAQMRQFFEKELVPGGLFYLTDQQVEVARARLTPEAMRQRIEQNEASAALPGPAGVAMAKLTLQDPLHLHDFIMDRLMASRPFKTYQNSEAFISPDGHALLIRVRGLQPPSEIEYSKAMTRCIEQLATSVNRDGLKLEYAGSYPIAAASEKAIRSDMIASITSSVIFLQLLFIVAYRKPIRLFILAFAPVAIGVLLGFAANSAVQATITPMTAVIGAILAGLAIDYSVYVIADYEAHRRNGDRPVEAARNTVLAITPAIFAAWLTTAIGFAAIGYSSVPGIRDFARIGALGLTGAFLSALLLLPATLALVDRRDQVQATLKPQMRLRTLPLLLFIARYWRWCVAGSLALLVASAVVLATSQEGVLPLEKDLTTMHPRPNPPLEAQQGIAKRFGASPDALLLHIRADSAEKLLSLSHAARERLLRSQVRGSGMITGTYGLADLLPDPAVVDGRLAALQQINVPQVISDFDAAIRDSIFEPSAYQPYTKFLQTLLGQRHAPDMADLLRYPALARDLLPSTAIRAQPPPDEAMMLVFTANPLDNQADRKAAVETIRKATADLSGVTLTGMSVVAYDTESTVHHDLPRLIGVAAAAVGLYLLLHFRRLLPAILATLPMLTSLLILLAAARLVDQRLNLVNLIAAPLLIGVDVDYGIFIVSLAASRSTFTRRSLAERLDGGCYAILVCVASALLGFGTLYFTSVPAVQSLGFAVAVGVIGSLIFTLLLRLPLLFASLPQGESPDAACVQEHSQTLR